jgi:hypothetical protein
LFQYESFSEDGISGFINYLFDEYFGIAMTFTVFLLLALVLLIVTIRVNKKKRSKENTSKYGDLKKAKKHKEDNYSYSYRFRKELPDAFNNEDSRHMYYLDKLHREFIQAYEKIEDRKRQRKI